MMVLSSCSRSFVSVTPDQFRHTMSKPGMVLLDVRHAEEYSEGHIPGAYNVDVLERGFYKKVKRIAGKEQTIMVNCKGGVRSKEAAKTLSRHGYNVIDLDKGYTQWIKEGLPHDRPVN